MFFEQRKLTTDLHTFLSIVVALLIIGSLFIYSSSSVFALEKFGSAHFFVKRHLMGLAYGLVAGCCAALFPLTALKKLSPFLFLSSLSLTALTLIPRMGTKIHGSSRWLHIKNFGFQPSELLKISLILYISYLFSKKEKPNVWPLIIIMGLISLILLKQPDFGMTITLGVTTFIMFFIIHGNLKHMFTILGIAIPLVCALVYSQPYRLKRIMTFLNPWNDPQGAGFQIIQSLIAIGSGSWLGLGVSHSKQKFFYLPMQHTDFIFSIIAEETGFIGSTLLICLFMLLFYFGMRIAWNLKDTFSSFMTMGFNILICLQVIINICVATGLLPTKGIGLPFVSYGNSALICSMIMIGLITNAVRETR